MEETYVVRKFLRCMPEIFLPIVSTIEQFGDIENMSLEEAIGRLKTHEEMITRGLNSGEQECDHLLLTHAEWMARQKKGGQL